GRARGEAAGAEDPGGPDVPQEGPRLQEARGHVHDQVADVAAVPVAPELARSDGMEREARLGRPSRLDAVAAADPVDLGTVPTKGRRPGPPCARVAPRPPPRPDDPPPP